MKTIILIRISTEFGLITYLYNILRYKKSTWYFLHIFVIEIVNIGKILKLYIQINNN